MSVHIHAPKGTYIGQIRLRGHRLWQTVSKSRKSPKPAMIAAINAMGENHKRARVLFCTEWYEPNIVMELNR
jgi:hypothetical protein